MRRLGESIKGNYKKPCECGCGNLIWNKGSDGRIRHYYKNHSCRIPNSGRFKKGETGINCINYRNARIISGNGYVEKTISTRMVYEHRLIWEEEYNASLLSWADVHHKDHNRQNNVWYNLEAMMRRKHHQRHALKIGLGKHKRVGKKQPTKKRASRGQVG